MRQGAEGDVPAFASLAFELDDDAKKSQGLAVAGCTVYKEGVCVPAAATARNAACRQRVLRLRVILRCSEQFATVAPLYSA